MRTRAEPLPYAEGRVFHVYPHGFEGTKIEPSFEGLICAYNSSCGGGDFATAGRPRVRAGDTLLVHAGLYRYIHLEYGGVNRAFPFEGTYYLTADGTPERPIAIKAAGDGEVIFDGNGNFALFNVMAADCTYFEGITFRNTEFAIWAGQQFIAGARGLTVKRSRFEDVGVGVFTNYSGSSNFYIADNRFHGRNDPERMIGWFYGAGTNPDRSTHSPRRMTRSISSVFRMSASGSAFSTTRSATLPASRVPKSASPTGGICAAPVAVAATMASIGVRPASTYISISWCMPQPNGTFGVPASLPIATATPASCIVLTKSSNCRNEALRSSNPGSSITSARRAGSSHPARASGLNNSNAARSSGSSSSSGCSAKCQRFWDDGQGRCEVDVVVQAHPG